MIDVDDKPKDPRITTWYGMLAVFVFCFGSFVLTHYFLFKKPLIGNTFIQGGFVAFSVAAALYLINRKKK